jgi:hypothetical protein
VVAKGGVTANLAMCSVLFASSGTGSAAHLAALLAFILPIFFGFVEHMFNFHIFPFQFGLA